MESEKGPQKASWSGRPFLVQRLEQHLAQNLVPEKESPLEPTVETLCALNEDFQQ